MINDLVTSVGDISSEELDKLFAETPDNQPNADDLKVKSPSQDDPKNVLVAPASTDIPTIDLDKDLEVPAEEKKDDANDKEKEGKDKAKEGQEGKDKDKPVDVKEDKKTDKTNETSEGLKELLKNSVDYLVEKGLFKDFEGREETEMTEELFTELLEKQVEAKVDELYSSKKKSAGEFGEAILEYLENGGEADKMIDLFKERQVIENFDIKDDDSKKELVTKWYKEVHNWKSDKIKKYVDNLITEETLDSEAEEIKQKYEQNYNKQIQQLQQEQEFYRQDQIKKQKSFETNISKAIDESEDFDDKRKRYIKDSIFKFKTLEDGTKVNDFYIKFAEWQSDPKKYVELAEFIMDKDNYLKRKAIDVENKVVNKTFKLIKGNGAVDKTNKPKHVEKDDIESKDYKGTNFSVVLK